MNTGKRKTKIIVVINQKGGVGKSTQAFHLAHAAAGLPGKSERRVLALDLDSQGNFSQYLTGDLDIINDEDGGVGLFLEGKPFVPSKTTHPGIDLLHGHSALDRYDNDMAIEDRGYSAEMRHELRGLGYDYVIIDTPPAVGFRHMAALCWADVAVIPMEPVMSSIVGFQNVLMAIENVILPINPGLKWCGVVNRANMRVKSHREKEEYVRKTYGSQIVATLATRTAVSDAMEEEPAQPVWMRKGAPKDLREEWQRFCEKVIEG
jgi:chromosome partitioning protein